MMFTRLRDLYYNTDLGYWIIHPFKTVFDLLIYGCISDRKILEFRYRRVFNKKLNLDDPQTLSEKLQWLKINDRTELHTRCADKLSVREFVGSLVGEDILIPLFFRTKNVSALRPEELPDMPMVVKANHDSAGGELIYDKAVADWKTIRKKLKRRMRTNFYYKTKEWQYKNIVPEVLVEKMLQCESGDPPLDYKLHCFNGKVVFTQVDIDRHTNHTRNLYDREWNLLPCEWIYKNGRQVDSPSKYSDMIDIAEKLAAKFVYVRVDLYFVDSSIYFGELTFHSESGIGKFTPSCYDEKFGKMLKIDAI